VRDSGAGIGTVTYIKEDTLAFGGLGHGICDGESGALIPIARGSVMDVTVGGIKRGAVGAPGELRGHFAASRIGTLMQNTACGVFGTLTDCPAAPAGTLPIGFKEELHDGAATLWCTLDDHVTRSYGVEISDIHRNATGNKCFTVTVTDMELLAKTGGIVQGMSGSPIVQDGRLVGAVTHVLIGDPTTGYGIFIENMLNAANIPMAKAS
jgi:stage IV sporulation protein B